MKLVEIAQANVRFSANVIYLNGTLEDTILCITFFAQCCSCFCSTCIAFSVFCSFHVSHFLFSLLFLRLSRYMYRTYLAHSEVMTQWEWTKEVPARQKSIRFRYL